PRTRAENSAGTWLRGLAHPRGADGISLGGSRSRRSGSLHPWSGPTGSLTFLHLCDHPMADLANPSTMSVAFIEGLYADYLKDPSSVPPDWREYFRRTFEQDAFAKRPQLG